MSAAKAILSFVTATAQEVLPKFGLAFLVDEHDTMWGVTRSTEGPGLDTLQAGQRVRLALDHHAEFSMVCAYEPQN